MSRRTIVTVAEAQKELSCCRNTVLKYAHDADAIIRIGRAIRVDLDRLLNWLEMNSKNQ